MNLESFARTQKARDKLATASHKVPVPGYRTIPYRTVPYHVYELARIFCYFRCKMIYLPYRYRTMYTHSVYLQSWLGFSVDFEGKMLYLPYLTMFTHIQIWPGFLLISGIMIHGTYDVAGVLLELKDPGVDLLLDELNIQDLLNLLLDLGVVGQQQGGQHLPHLGEQHQSLQQQQIYRDCTHRFCISIVSDPDQ